MASGTSGRRSLTDWQLLGRDFAHACSRNVDRARKEEVPRDSVPRERCEGLSPEDFWEKYEKVGQPCMIAGVPEKEGWPVERLEGDESETFFREAMEMGELSEEAHGLKAIEGPEVMI